MTSSPDLRQTLRNQLRQARNYLSPNEQSLAAESLSARVINYLQTYKSKKVALYLANDGEISPHILCEYFWQQKIETYLPVVQGKHLKFALYHSNSVWQENQFGIKEPLVDFYLSGEELDIVLLPLVGFDDKGGRLGMGGGFYDRTFERKQENLAPLLIGLAHDCQQVDSIPTESWDVPLQAMITPTQTINIP